MTIQTVLIVGSPDTVDMYAAGLSCAGHRTLTATDTSAAAHRVRSDHPSAVVVDLQLPGGGSWGLICALKSDPRTRHVPVILLTGWVSKEGSDAPPVPGCAAVLRKPCLPNELALALDAILP